MRRDSLAVDHRLCLAAALAIGSFLSPRLAHGFEREWHLGGGAGFAALGGTDYAAGPALGVHAAYGLSDMFDLRLELGVSRHVYTALEAPTAPAALLVSAAAGPAYKLDIGDWIPYAALLLGYYRFMADSPSALGLATPGDDAAGLSLALGLDYAIGASLGLGLQIRYHSLFGSLPESFEETPYFSMLLRAEWRFGR
jgi:hypothetical protein